MARSTDAEFKSRVSVVYNLLIKGYDRGYILQFSAETIPYKDPQGKPERDNNGKVKIAKYPWGVEERQVSEYIRVATKEIKKHAEKDNIYELGLAKIRLNDLLSKTTASKDHRTSLAIIKERSELLGLKTQQEVKEDERKIIILEEANNDD